MADIYLKKMHGVLVPASEASEVIVANMSQGRVIKLKYSFPRNYENHKRFFAFIKTTFDIQDHFDNITHYRKWLIGKAGHFTTIKLPNGNVIFDTDSIAFEKMDEMEFRQLFHDCVDALLSEFDHRISRDELLRVIDFV
jgi:hypothetical protein